MNLANLLLDSILQGKSPQSIARITGPKPHDKRGAIQSVNVPFLWLENNMLDEIAAVVIHDH